MSDTEQIICFCRGVTEQEIIDAIKNDACDTIEKIQEKTDAGTACGDCIEDIETILKQNL